MMKSKMIVRLLRVLLTMLGAGLGAGVAALLLPLLLRQWPELAAARWFPPALYAGLILLMATVLFAFSRAMSERLVKWADSLTRRWDSMPTRQILLTTVGLVLGLATAALATQLILSAGSTFLSITFSAIVYLLLGYVGMQLGYRRYRGGQRVSRRERRRLRQGDEESLLEEAVDMLEAEEEEALPPPLPRKLLDTSVLIDGRVLDILKAGFLEGDIVVARFVLGELQHIADSADAMRRARGRRGLDILARMQKEVSVVIDDTDYPDTPEVDVKLLKLCRDKGGVVVTNDYNLNKVASVSGIRVLNVNDLSNALKPMLMAGEELRVQVVREGKEPGQGVSYLDDGTMIVIEGGRRALGETTTIVVNTVLQTSAGRMIFARLKAPEAAPAATGAAPAM